MKKFLLTLIFMACFFIGNQARADYFVEPPHSIPYTVNGHTYNQMIQQIYTYDLANSHNYQLVLYCDSNYFATAKPVLSALDNSNNPFGLWLFTMNFPNIYSSDTGAWDYNLVMGNTSMTNQSFCISYRTTDGGTTWLEEFDYSLSSVGYSYDFYGNFGYTDFIRSTFDLYWSSQPFVPSSPFTNQFQDGQSSKTNRLIIPASSFGGSTQFSFPIGGLTAYNAPMSSVMDHSMATPYAEDDIVLAFNGERGDKVYGFSLGCYKKSGGGNFGSGFNYVGTTGTGGKPYFCYDGHPGYDYPQALGVDILAPAAGKLCVATANITQQSPANVWRNPTVCGDIPSVVTGRWLNTGGLNTFYILHGPMFINGSTDDYMTVFLHSNNLENTVVWSTVASQGYVDVTRGQYIADVGSVGADNANHIHLEFYKKNGSGGWDRVDPYGNGTSNILWQH